MWDAAQYARYAAERARPFFDLLAQVKTDPATIVDLGCGPGNVTMTFVDRWPTAHVLGVDSSPEMLAQAQTVAIPGRLEFTRGDIGDWTPAQPVDLVVSNAALQWVPNHDRILHRITDMVTPHGTVAVQIPNRFDGPAQHALDETARDPRWSASIHGVGLKRDSVMPLTWYVDRLHDLGFTVNAWGTTYVHVLTGADPVLEWMKGTALRPILQRVDDAHQNAYLDALGSRLREAYPARGDVTLFPFARLFFVATR